jgi:hypothetical protein
VAVLNLPGLATTLAGAGFAVVGDGKADTKTTVELLRLVQKNNGFFIVIIAINDPSLRAWATLQAAMGVKVLIVRSAIFANGDGIPQSRIIDLPCTVDEIMANFGAPSNAEYGEIEIGADGRVVAADGEPDDSFNVFSTNDTSTPNIDSPNIINDVDGPASDVESSSSKTQNIFADNHPSAPFENVFASESDRSLIDVDELVDIPDLTDAFAEIEEITLPITGPLLEPHTSLGDAPHETSPPPRPLRQRDVTESVFSRTHALPSNNERRGEVIVVFAGKGGVGKTTTTIALSERSATVISGLRTVGEDASRGQGDWRTFLKLDDSGLPSVYDAAVSRNADVFRDVLINPKRLNAHRGDRRPLHFGVILSPEKDQADPSIVTPGVYASAIEYARSHADLVFIDTQIIEARDTSGIIDEVIVPLLLEGAWGLGLSDSSTAGVQNLIWVLNNFVERGVPTSRLMVALNNVAPDSLIDAGAISSYVERYATWMGSVSVDLTIENIMNLGDVPGAPDVEATPDFTALLDRILYHVTGVSGFAYSPQEDRRAKGRIKINRRVRGRR